MGFTASQLIADPIQDIWRDWLIAALSGTNVDGSTYGLVVTDDNVGFEAQHVTLTASTDTTITFAQQVRVVRISNYDTANRVLVKNGAIASNTDSTAARIGIAPAANIPGDEYFPFKTTTIHLRSAGASEVNVVGFF